MPDATTRPDDGTPPVPVGEGSFDLARLRRALGLSDGNVPGAGGDGDVASGMAGPAAQARRTGGPPVPQGLPTDDGDAPKGEATPAVRADRDTGEMSVPLMPRDTAHFDREAPAGAQVGLAESPDEGLSFDPARSARRRRFTATVGKLTLVVCGWAVTLAGFGQFIAEDFVHFAEDDDTWPLLGAVAIVLGWWGWRWLRIEFGGMRFWGRLLADAPGSAGVHLPALGRVAAEDTAFLVPDAGGRAMRLSLAEARRGARSIWRWWFWACFTPVGLGFAFAYSWRAPQTLAAGGALAFMGLVVWWWTDFKRYREARYRLPDGRWLAPPFAPLRTLIDFLRWAGVRATRLYRYGQAGDAYQHWLRAAALAVAFGWVGAIVVGGPRRLLPTNLLLRARYDLVYNFPTWWMASGTLLALAVLPWFNWRRHAKAMWRAWRVVWLPAFSVLVLFGLLYVGSYSFAKAALGLSLLALGVSVWRWLNRMRRAPLLRELGRLAMTGGLILIAALTMQPRDPVDQFLLLVREANVGELPASTHATWLDVLPWSERAPLLYPFATDTLRGYGLAWWYGGYELPARFRDDWAAFGGGDGGAIYLDDDYAEPWVPGERQPGERQLSFEPEVRQACVVLTPEELAMQLGGQSRRAALTASESERIAAIADPTRSRLERLSVLTDLLNERVREPRATLTSRDVADGDPTPIKRFTPEKYAGGAFALVARYYPPYRALLEIRQSRTEIVPASGMREPVFSPGAQRLDASAIVPPGSVPALPGAKLVGSAGVVTPAIEGFCLVDEAGDFGRALAYFDPATREWAGTVVFPSYYVALRAVAVAGGRVEVALDSRGVTLVFDRARLIAGMREAASDPPSLFGTPITHLRVPPPGITFARAAGPIPLLSWDAPRSLGGSVSATSASAWRARYWPSVALQAQAQGADEEALDDAATAWDALEERVNLAYYRYSYTTVGTGVFVERIALGTLDRRGRQVIELWARALYGWGGESYVRAIWDRQERGWLAWDDGLQFSSLANLVVPGQ